MSTLPGAQEMLDRQYLEIRARILEVAASLDRIDRAEGAVSGDPRSERLREGIAELLGEEPHRAERIQMLFSLPYDPAWKSNLKLPR